MMMNPMMQNMTPSMMAPVGGPTIPPDVMEPYPGFFENMRLESGAVLPMDEYNAALGARDAGVPQPYSLAMDRIRQQQMMDEMIPGPSGLISFDQYAQSQQSDPDYGQFMRKQMNMNVEPMQQRMTMTTSPRTPFDTQGFNSGMQLMNMGLGLLD